MRGSAVKRCRTPLIPEQGPFVHREGPRFRAGRAPAEDGCAGRILGKENAPFTFSPPHVVEGSRGIEASLAGHTGPPVVEYGR